VYRGSAKNLYLRRTSSFEDAMTKASEKKINFFFITEGGEMKVEFIRFQLKLKDYAIRLATPPAMQVLQLVQEHE
jgi:hypothetical protein